MLLRLGWGDEMEEVKWDDNCWLLARAWVEEEGRILLTLVGPLRPGSRRSGGVEVRKARLPLLGDCASFDAGPIRLSASRL